MSANIRKRIVSAAAGVVLLFGLVGCVGYVAVPGYYGPPAGCSYYDGVCYRGAYGYYGGYYGGPCGYGYRWTYRWGCVPIYGY